MSVEQETTRRYNIGGPILVGHPGFQMWMPGSETQDPCFDTCKIADTAGVIAAGTSLNNLPCPEGGLYWVEFCVGLSLNGGNGFLVGAEVQRTPTAALEQIDRLLASDLGGTERTSCILKMKPGGAFILRLITGPTSAAGTITSCIRFKRLYRS